MRRFDDEDLTGAEFRECDLSRARMVGVVMQDAEIDGLVTNLVVNGVEVMSYVEAELDRRHPVRLLIRSDQPDDLRDGLRRELTTQKVIAQAIASKLDVSDQEVNDAFSANRAQFNVPEFGSGQWMRGGMTMVGDMFNNSLKAAVDNLCTELSNLLASQPGVVSPVTQSQSQSQGSGGGIAREGVSLFVPQASYQLGAWWPSELGNAAATGAQNSLRYAYFPVSRRLAIDYGGRIEVASEPGCGTTVIVSLPEGQAG